MPGTSSDRDRDDDGNFDLDHEVNELMHDMMMKVNCITL